MNPKLLNVHFRLTSLAGDGAWCRPLSGYAKNIQTTTFEWHVTCRSCLNKILFSEEYAVYSLAAKLTRLNHEEITGESVVARLRDDPEPDEVRLRESSTDSLLDDL